ncbi:MAG: hypothetical protein OXF26_13530 [Alphaproteobacteria bacterium]|nr:hypothetical protein [Alphaproteobacteria bacterium]MCY4231867.1 hypothetical protein [Alphaproteobacteria bacterium]MCY4317678.1 hypothetical protein [Alphaproteobacteria bacterium]
MSHAALLLSALAHLGLLILAAVGLPALHDPPDPFENEVRVRAKLVSEHTEAKAPLPPVEPLAPETPPEPPEPVAAEPLPIEPVTPPFVAPPAPPVEPEKPVEVAALVPPKPKPPLEPKPPVAKPGPPQAKAPPKPPELAPTPPPPPQAAPKNPADDLATLRKAASGDDLATLRKAALVDGTPSEEAEEAAFTVAELERLKQQLTRCWQTIPGLAPSERHVVKFEVKLGPDRRVTQPIKTIEPKSSRSYRAARERAERALRHPDCEQIDLPSTKMALWLREPLILEFDPSQMQ